MLHGLFKSMVFILFGYSILKNKHKQDIRSWNNLVGKNNSFNFMILIPLSCLAGIQTSPVYFYKHFSFYGFTDNCNSFLLNQSIL